MEAQETAVPHALGWMLLSAGLLAAGPTASAAGTGSEVPRACLRCHAREAGFMGAAPVGNRKVWQQMVEARGLSGLVQSVIEGRGSMPPRGGTNLSDAGIEAAVRAMLRESGVEAGEASP